MGKIIRFTDSRQTAQAVKWGVSPRWSFDPNSAWASIETTIKKTHSALHLQKGLIELKTHSWKQ